MATQCAYGWRGKLWSEQKLHVSSTLRVVKFIDTNQVHVFAASCKPQPHISRDKNIIGSHEIMYVFYV